MSVPGLEQDYECSMADRGLPFAGATGVTGLTGLSRSPTICHVELDAKAQAALSEFCYASTPQ